LALGCSRGNVVSLRTGSKSGSIGEAERDSPSVAIKEVVQQKVPSRMFTKNRETCEHKRKEGRKVIVDEVATQRRRRLLLRLHVATL
jgi:hypothetical protein